MATVVSASSATITSILGTLQTVAHTAQRTINTASAGLDMVDNYVDSARHRQIDTSKVHMHHFRKNLLQESAAEQARKEKILQQEMSGDSNLAKLFAENLKELQSLFTETEA